jgi:hypothetical protein
MRRASFYALVKTSRKIEQLQYSIHTFVEEKFAMFLNVVCHKWRFRLIHNTFKRSIETISRYFKQAVFAVGELRGEMIKLPIGYTPPQIKSSYKWWPYFKVGLFLYFHFII